MRSFLRAVALCVLLSPCPGAGAEDFVLLRNGNVMTGRASYQGQRLRLERSGSEFWFEAADVATVGTSQRGLYQWRRDQLVAPTADDHLNLASWCLKQGLHPEASRELLEARALDPRSRKAAALARRLANEAFAPQAQADVTLPSSRRGPAMTEDQLDRLPPGVVEEFTRHIQPMLVNNCTSSGCHQTTSQGDFLLNRDLLHGLANYRSTRANLAEVLEAIDAKSLEDSPLLLAANGPHAGRATGAFTGRHAELAVKLEEWVAAVAEPIPTDPTGVAQRSQNANGVFGLVKAQRERDQFVQQASAHQPLRGLRDEFDPAIFNRLPSKGQD